MAIWLSYFTAVLFQQWRVARTLLEGDRIGLPSASFYPRATTRPFVYPPVGLDASASS